MKKYLFLLILILPLNSCEKGNQKNENGGWIDGNIGTCKVETKINFENNLNVDLGKFNDQQLNSNLSYYRDCLDIYYTDKRDEVKILLLLENELVKRGDASVIADKYLRESDWGKNRKADVSDLEKCTMNKDKDCLGAYLTYLEKTPKYDANICNKFHKAETILAKEEANYQAILTTGKDYLMLSNKCNMRKIKQ